MYQWEKKLHVCRPAKSPGISGSLQKWGVISRSPGIVKKTPGIEGIWLQFFFLRKKCELLSYLRKMCVSTHEYHLMLGKNWISQLDITEKSCYYPPPLPLNRVGSWRSRKNPATTPPPLNRVGSWRSRKNPAITPPPTESRRLLEITDKTQEIQQPQLGSSASGHNQITNSKTMVWVPVYLQSNANSWFERHLVSAKLRKHCGLHSCLGEFNPFASLYRRF